MTGTAARVIQADARRMPVAGGSVDLIVTSPPYFGLRSYQDGGEHYEGQIGDEATPAEFVDALVAATAEMARVLKPSGSIWVNLGDKYGAKSLIGIPWRYALRCIDELGLILRAEVIWSKPNGLPESVTDRVRRSHETWFHFTKGSHYFSAVDEIREAAATADPANPSFRANGKSNKRSKRVAPGQTVQSTMDDRGRVHPLGKLPGSVWTIPTQPLRVPESLGIDHFAAFPMEWPRRIIQGWSPEGGIVLDPFGGTGTTALVAKALGRHGISNDMSADYCRLAQWRTNDEAELARAMQVKKPAAQVQGQASLLDLIDGVGA